MDSAGSDPPPSANQPPLGDCQKLQGGFLTAACYQAVALLLVAGLAQTLTAQGQGWGGQGGHSGGLTPAWGLQH